MKKVYLGIDIGSISTLGVSIDEDNKVTIPETAFLQSKLFSKISNCFCNLFK